MRVVGIVLYEDFCDVVEGRIVRIVCDPLAVVVDVVTVSFRVVSESDVERSVVV